MASPDHFTMSLDRWLPPAPLKRGRERPPRSTGERQTYPSEAAESPTDIIRETFEDYGGKRGSLRPLAWKAL